MRLSTLAPLHTQRLEVIGASIMTQLLLDVLLQIISEAGRQRSRSHCLGPLTATSVRGTRCANDFVLVSGAAAKVGPPQVRHRGVGIDPRTAGSRGRSSAEANAPAL